jgi:hypothetical protein
MSLDLPHRVTFPLAECRRSHAYGDERPTVEVTGFRSVRSEFRAFACAADNDQPGGDEGSAAAPIASGLHAGSAIARAGATPPSAMSAMTAAGAKARLCRRQLQARRELAASRAGLRGAAAVIASFHRHA